MSRHVPRVLYLLSHPIQYQSPMLRYLAHSGRVHVHTIYARRAGSAGYFDKGFGQRIVWDVPLTDGFSHEFLPAWFGDERTSRVTPWSLGLGSAFRRFSPDAVWIHGYDTLNAVRTIAAARSRGLPVIARSDVEYSDAHGGPTTRFLKDRALRVGFRWVDAFLAVGERNATFYRDHGVPDTKIFKAPYSVDNDLFRRARESAAAEPSLSHQFGLPPGRPIFLFSGKLIPRKRPLDAIHALALLRDQLGCEASLLVVGSGELAMPMRKMAEQLGLADNVVLAGFLNQSEIPSVYARAQALLLTSERERWGLVANEAMAAGCPVITYHSVGCADDLVIDDVSGRMVRTGNIQQLASAMAALCDPGRRARLAEGASRRINNYSFETVEQGLLAALERVTP